MIVDSMRVICEDREGLFLCLKDSSVRMNQTSPGSLVRTIVCFLRVEGPDVGLSVHQDSEMTF